MTKLDRKKSYGTVYGDPKVGFVQDDKCFRHDGTLLVEEPNSTTAAPAESKALDAVGKIQKPRSDEQKAAQSEAMKKIWAERRARVAEAQQVSES